MSWRVIVLATLAYAAGNAAQAGALEVKDFLHFPVKGLVVNLR